MGYTKKLLFLIDQKKLFIFVIFALFFLSSLFEILGISLVGGYLSYLAEFELGDKNIIKKLFGILNTLGFKVSSVNSLALIIIVILLIRFFFQIIANFFILTITTKTSKNLRSKLISIYLNLNYIDFVNNDSSSYYNEITNLTDQLVNLITVLLKILNDILLLALIMIMLLVVNKYIFTFLIIFILLLFFLNKIFFTKKISNLGILINSLLETIFKNFKESLSAYKQIKVIKKTNYFIEQINTFLKKHMKLLIKYNFLLAFIKYFIEFTIAVILILVTLALFSYYNKSEAILIITIFGISSIRALPLVASLINSTNVLYYSKNAIDKLYKSANYSINFNIENRETNDDSGFKFNSLEIKNLDFSYNNFTLLQNINLKINKNQITLITGKSGSGKTTLLDIICGLIQPSKGTFIINNSNSLQNLKSFRNKIFYMAQKSFILNDTLEKNIAFTNRILDETRFNEVIKSTKLEDLALKIKNTHLNNLGENASKISGGELQRISLARALYADKDFLILDEFTSSLDKKTEFQIFETIKEISKSKTVLIVSHNPDLGEFADKILQIANNEVIQIK